MQEPQVLHLFLRQDVSEPNQQSNKNGSWLQIAWHNHP